MPSHCDFVFVCDKRWIDLKPTNVANARYCGDCRKNVFKVTSKDEMALSAALGRCAAVLPFEAVDAEAEDAQLILLDVRPAIVGMIAQDQNRGGNADVVLAVLLVPRTPLAMERRKELRRFFPWLFDGGRNELALLDGKSVRLRPMSLAQYELLERELRRGWDELRLQPVVISERVAD